MLLQAQSMEDLFMMSALFKRAVEAAKEWPQKNEI
jgi:hypothetical protein